jgi:hypothetical protein
MRYVSVSDGLYPGDRGGLSTDAGKMPKGYRGNNQGRKSLLQGRRPGGKVPVSADVKFKNLT